MYVLFGKVNMEVTFTLQFGKTNVEIQCGSYISPIQLSITPPHDHRQGELHLILSGTADYRIGQTDYLLQSGDFVYIPPRCSHSAKAHQTDANFIVITIRGGPKQPIASSISPSLLDGIYAACAESRKEDNLTPLMPYFYILLGCILHPNGPTVRENRDYECVIMRYLDSYYSRDTTLASLAEYVGISPKQVQRIIQKETGHTFLEELTSRRMSAARYLEENTSMTATEIAHYVGYNSYSGYWKARKQYLQKEQE